MDTLTTEIKVSDFEKTPNEFKLFDADLTKKGAAILRAMNHKLRRHILLVIDKSGSSNVTSIYKQLNIEQSVASQHLAILRRAKIVSATRTGKQIQYTINYERIAHYMSKVKEMLT